MTFIRLLLLFLVSVTTGSQDIRGGAGSNLVIVGQPEAWIVKSSHDDGNGTTVVTAGSVTDVPEVTTIKN